MPKSFAQAVISFRLDLLLLAIMVIAVLVRFWGIGFGMPHDGVRPDEAHIVELALSFGSGDLNPKDFVYPSFPMYLLFGFYILYFVFGWFIGRDISPTDFALRYHLDPTHFFIISRSISALLGVATVYITYRVATQLFHNKKIGVIAAFFLAVAYLHARDSHFGTVDVPLTFWIMWAMLYISRISSEKALKNYLIVGFLAGLATATKYIGLLLVFPLVFSHLSHFFGKHDGILHGLVDRRLVVFLIVLILTFLILTPYSVLDFPTFSADILRNARNLTESWAGIDVGRGWFYHLRFSLWYGLGWSLFVVSLIGMVLLFIKNLRRAWILFSFPLVYYLLVGLALTAFVRYAIPLVPFLCMAAAWFVVGISERFLSGVNTSVRGSIMLAMAVMIALPSILTLVRFDRLLIERDNRLIAADWMELNLGDHTSFYQTRGFLYTVQLPPTVESLERLHRFLSPSRSRRGVVLSEVARKQIEYFKREDIIGYDEWIFDEERKRFVAGGEETEALPDYIVTQISHLPYGKVSETMKTIIEQHYVLIQSFVVSKVDNSRNLYDLQDSFYVPYFGFDGVVRPGPNIYIYQKVSES